jgi:hypothetical protein
MCPLVWYALQVLADRSELQRQRTHSVPKPKFDLKVAQASDFAHCAYSTQ